MSGGKRKTLGILGGMGPEATAYFFELVIRLTAADEDQDHVPVVIRSDPRVPHRTKAILEGGPSPLPSLIEGARALAFLRGRTYVLPEDVTDLVADVFRHRLVLSYQALADAMTADQIIQKVMQHVQAPDKPLESHVRAGAKS